VTAEFWYSGEHSIKHLESDSAQSATNTMICLSCSGDNWTHTISGLSSVYDRLNRYSISRCVECGLSQTDPQPDATFLSNLYSDTYSYEIHELVRAEKRRRAKGLLKVWGVFNFTNKNVLEIGCGSGVLLREIKGRGANVCGCEIDKISSEVANRALGEQVVANVDATELLKNIDQFYDLIVISHVLEHLRNPVEVLKALRNSMAVDGSLLVVVPNLDSAPKAFLRKYWGYWQVPVHLTHFNTDSLIYLIENCGFQIETVATRNADFMSLGLFLSNILRLKKSEPGQVSSQLIRTMSWCWSWTYRFGKQDLVVVARPIKN